MAATRAPIDMRVKRQDGPDVAPYWHDFRVPWAPRLTADPLKVLYGPLRRREGEGREPPHSPEGP